MCSHGSVQYRSVHNSQSAPLTPSLWEFVAMYSSTLQYATACFWNNGPAKFLVKRSALFSSVGIHTRLMIPAYLSSRKIFCRTLAWCVHPVTFQLFNKLIMPLLSTSKIISFLTFKHIDSITLILNSMSVAHCVAAADSASVTNNVTNPCILQGIVTGTTQKCRVSLTLHLQIRSFA